MASDNEKRQQEGGGGGGGGGGDGGAVEKKKHENEHDGIELEKVPVVETRRAVVNVDFEAALGENRPDPWGRGHIVLYGLCLLMYLNSTMSGYDGSLMGSINALPEYNRYFNLDKPNASTGIVFSIFQIAQMVGSLFLWVADWRGRRFAMFIGAAGIVVGAIIQATTTTMRTFIGARFIISFFSTIALAGAPMYLIEISPPLYRGTVAGMYNTFYYLGSIIATFSVYGARIHYTGTDLTWRLPIWLQILCPGLVCCCVWFVPESPRWLISVDRYEEAREIIIRYHANGDENHPVVDLQLREMQEQLAAAGGVMTPASYLDFRDLFKTRSRRYRTFLNVTFSWFGQFSGNNVASYYLPQMVANVGVTKTETVLLLNAIYAIVGWIAAGTGARLHDVLGRRKVLLASTIGCTVSLAILAGTAAGYANTGSFPSSAASIAFIYIFGMVFALGFTSMQPIYPAEVQTNDMRAKGFTLHQLTSGAAGFVNTFASPIAMRNIKYWFYVFFVFWDLFEAVVIYFFFVETKGRTLEELEEVFLAKNPRKASTKERQVEQIRTEGGITAVREVD